MKYWKSNKVIYETYDYDEFVPLLGNRDQDNEKAIMKSIDKVGYITDPVLINEKNEIIDGQNRLAALKAKKLPILFIIEEGIGLEECRQMNINRKNWTSIDYINSYAIEGNENYKRLLSLINMYKKQYGFEGVCALSFPYILPTKGALSGKTFTDGKLIFTEEQYELANRRLITSLEYGITDICKERKYKARYFYSALGYCFLHKDVSIKRFAEKLRLYSADLPTCASTSDQLKYFSEIYNKGCRGTGKVYLNVDWERGLYRKKGVVK